MTRAKSDKNLLITGGAGFIGSNYIPHFLAAHPDVNVVNLDKLTYAGDLSNLTEVSDNKNYTFVKGDICDTALLRELFNDYGFYGIIHFAAESHVDRSIASPYVFVKTNIEGTLALLETARAFWGSSEGEYSGYRFHHISTDEVYGSLGREGYFSEDSPYAPNSPYSASKAGADFLVRSYHHTYGMNTVISNCSNNFGPKQHDEKLIPTIIKAALNEEPIPIYGKGENIRDWLFVEDHCRAITEIFQRGISGETYLIGGNNEYNNLYIAQRICEQLDRLSPRPSGHYADLISFVKDRPGHDFRYAIDATKVKSEIGWSPEESFESGLEKTIHWYLNKYLKA